MKYIAVTIAFVFGFFAVLYTIGYIEMCLGITTPTEIPTAIEGTYDYSVTKMQLIGQNIGSLLFILLCITMFSYLFSLYHRQNKKKKDTYDKDNIKGPFVLYLRSFIDDKTTQKRVSFINDIRSEEEVLVEVMSDIAPVYAIGDPRDKKMPLGASRIYVDDEHWKSTAIDMMNRAEIVVLRLGKTDSFWWEVETAIKSIPIEKIMFVVPESKTFGNVAMLYKILLDYKIDIKQLNVNIEQKNQGSISSFLYFDKNGEAVTTEVKIPLFSHLILSYENILRNALAKFREKYGLKTNPQRTIRRSRILGILSVICILFIGSAKMFSDLVTLKCQMPYELVEECIKDKSFVEKYSDEVNGRNLTWGIVESRKGTFALDDNEYLFLFQVEALTMQSMNKGEFNLLQ